MPSSAENYSSMNGSYFTTRSSILATTLGLVKAFFHMDVSFPLYKICDHLSINIYLDLLCYGIKDHSTCVFLRLCEAFLHDFYQ